MRTSFFTIPKPFVGHIGRIQRNALQSWIASDPSCEVLVYGDESGSSDVARDLVLRHIPSVALNEYGTPLLSDVFASAQRESAGEMLCYINADILLLPDFFAAVDRIKLSRFLAIGQRWDLAVDESIDFSNGSWPGYLSRLVDSAGQLHPPGGSDFFLYPKGLFPTLPPFAVGRPGWDNWLIYHARSRGLPVVDMTPVVTVIHQNHDYAHVQASASGGLDYEGAEAKRNMAILSDPQKAFLLLDATRVLSPRGLVPAVSRPYLARRWATFPVLHPRTAPLAKLVIRARRALAGLFSTFSFGGRKGRG